MTVLEIVQLAAGVSTLIPMALADALKAKALLAPLGPDVQANVKNLEDAALVEDVATMREVNAWLASKGLPTL